MSKDEDRLKFHVTQKAIEECGFTVDEVEGMGFSPVEKVEPSEEPQVLVCMPTEVASERFADTNKHGSCSECGCAIVYRPDPELEPMTKVCLPCLPLLLEKLGNE